MTLSHCADGALLLIIGSVDRRGTALLRRRLDEALASGAASVAVDVAQLDVIELEGLELLARMSVDLRRQGGALRLVSPRPGLVRLIDLLGLEDELPIDRRFS